jgi:O-antigen/teichoic acid export membrane protein
MLEGGALKIISHRTADDADAPIRDAGRNLCIEDQDIENLNDSVAEQARMPGDAEILGRGISVSLTGGMVARGLNIVAQILIARFLGAATFGLYAIGWTLVRLLEPVITLGLESGGTYFGAHYQRHSASKFKGVLTQSIALSFLSGFTIGAVLYLAAPALAEHVFRKPNAAPVIRAFAPAFPLYAIFIVGGGMTRLSHRMQYYAYSSIGSTAFALVLLCILFMLGLGLIGAVVATVGGIAVGALMSIYFVRSLFPAVFAKKIQPEWLGSELLAFSIPLALGGLAASLLTFVDRLFVASFCTSAETGIYQAAGQLSIVFAILFGAFDSIFSPMVADLHTRGENERLAELYHVCAKWRVYVCAPLFVIILFAPVELVKSLYGSAYAQGAIPLMILSAGQLFAVIAGTSHAMLIMTGRQKTVVVIFSATLLLDLALNFVLVPRFGIVGAASAAAVSAAVLNLSTATAVKKYASISLFDMRYAKSLGAAAVACCVLYVLRPLEIGTPAFRLFIVAVLSIAAFTGSLIALGLDAEDWEVLDMIRARFRRREPLSLR